MDTSEKHMFFRILLSYLSVLIVPVLIGILIYHSAVTSATKIVRNYSHNMLNQSVNTIDARLKELESLPFFLESMPELISLSSYDSIPKGSPEMYDVYQFYKRMPKFSLINNIISNIQVVLLNNEFILMENNALRITPQTYAGLLSYTGMSYDDFLTFSRDRLYSNEFVPFTGTDGKVTPTVISSVTDGNTRFPLALIIVQLKESSLKKIMTELLIDPESSVFLLDENNNLITSVQGTDSTLSFEDVKAYLLSHPETDSEYQDDIVTTIQSRYIGWQYCIFSPKEAVMSSMLAAKQNVILLVGLSLVMSIAFTAMLCLHKASSLKKVAAYLSSGSQDMTFSVKDEFSCLVNAASKLKMSNQELQQNLLKQKPLLEATTLRNALSGAISKPEELQYLFTTLGIQPDHQYFSVLLVTASPADEEKHPEFSRFPVLLSALVREYIEKNAPCPVYCLDIDSRQKAVVFIGSRIEKNVFQKQLLMFADQTRHMAFEESSISLTFCVSDSYDMVDDLSKAYNQSVVISQHATRTQGQYFFTSTDIPEIQKLYVYPIQTELELIRLIKTGSQSDLTHLLDTIRNNNLVERALSSSMIRQLTFSIRSSIIRGLADLPQEQLTSDAYLKIRRTYDQTLDELFQAILQLNSYLVRINNQLNTSKNERQAEKIMEYINSHYTNSDFTIYTICEEFHISESFAYQIFREVIGTSFADLLEQIRIEQACQMLTEGNHLIKDIALQIGYTNDNSFRRAFKRVMGVTPGEFASN